MAITINNCILLVLIITSNALAPHREYNELSIFDDAHFYPNEGIYLEPAGQYLSYSGTITIPFVYVLPSISHITKSYCPGHDQLDKIHKVVLDHINTIVGRFKRTETLRPKRSLFPIVSVLTGGLSVWNTVEILSIKNKIQHMTDDAIHIDRAISTLTESQNMVIGRVGEVSALIGDHTRAINILINKTTCYERSSEEFKSFVYNWLYASPSEFLAAYSGSITGQVTPDLLSASNLREIIINHIEMKDTIYSAEPETIYEFGRVLLTEVYVDTHAHLKGVIQVPKILSIAPQPIYNVYTVNTIKKGLNIKYKLPEILICPTQKSCWIAPSNRCTKKTNRLICLYGTDIIPCTCFNTLGDNQTDTCTIQIRKQDTPIVVQTQAGVLVGGSQLKYNVYKRMGNVDILSSVLVPKDHAQIITVDSGDWLTIADNVYSTLISGFIYNFSSYITSNDITSDIDPLKIDSNWKDLDSVKYTPIRFDQIKGNDGLYILIITINIILVTAVVYLIWKTHYKSTSNNKRPLLPHNLSGLR